MNRKTKMFAALLMALILLISSFSGCSSATPAGDTNSSSGTQMDISNKSGGKTEKASYTQIKSDKVFSIMEEESGYIILDVRTQAEFDSGHIPDAICIPNEEIQAFKPDNENDMITGLDDKEQMILIYCRSGNRSKQAAQKLADLGYTQIYEFGGIIDWPGKIVTS